MSVSFGDAPKSILKPPSDGTKKKLPTPEEARRIAFTHASALQIRKALESSVLDSLTYLLDLPTTVPTHPASAPSRHDIRAFKHHLRFFSPSDYDDLIEERNVASCCGYALCGNPRRRAKVQSRLARVAGGRWVERKEVERFCGEECARRALWVRVQLSTEPAWTRSRVVGNAEVDENTGAVRGIDLDSEEPAEGWDEAKCEIRLMEESEELKRDGAWSNANDKDVERLAEDLKGIGIRDPGGLAAIRSGEGTVQNRGGPTVDVIERRVKQVTITLPEEEEANATAIEGYVPKSQR